MSEDSRGLSNSNDDELPPEVIGENLPASVNGDDEELKEVIVENLPASLNGDDEELKEVIVENLPASFNGDNEEQHLVEGKKHQEKFLRIVSPVSPARPYCCYAVIAILTVVVIALFVALLLSGKTEQDSRDNTYAACPRNWIAFGNKCFYFSEDLGNQTFSQNYCVALSAQLAKFDNEEELNFLKRYKGPSDHWIGLHRESSHHPWMWADNTEYNNLVPTRGKEKHAYLSDRGISSGRNYIHKKWICSKPYSYALQCPIV